MSRQQKTAQTRAEIVAAARRVFSREPYPAVTLRRIAAEIGRTTGSITGHFEDKAALWREAMGTPPPVDTALTRHADGIERALRRLVAFPIDEPAGSPAWDQACAEARLALRTLDRAVRGPIARRRPHPARSAPDAAATAPVDVDLRQAMVSALIEEIDRSGWRPIAFEEAIQDLTEACERIAGRESGTASDEEVRDGAVRAAASLLVAAAAGISDPAPTGPDAVARVEAAARQAWQDGLSPGRLREDAVPKNRAEQKAETLARITETARRLFTENPYDEVSARRVAKAAGLTTGAIYPYFRTKPDLWRGVMGTPPPKDSALTRQAGDIERALRRLLQLDAEGERNTEAWAHAVTEARSALDTLDRTPGPKPRPRRSPRSSAATDPGP